MTVHCEQSMKREKTNKMQQSGVYYQLLSQHVSGIIMPIFRRTKAMLLYLVSVSTCFGHHYAHLQENKGPFTVFGVCLNMFRT